MDSRSRRIARAGALLAGWLIGAVVEARGQESPPDAGAPKRKADGAPGQRQGTAKAGPKKGAAKAGPKKEAAKAAGEKAPRREPPEDFQEGIRKTVERRRQRRARQAQALGTSDAQPPGAIAPWPMPPALIIRQTPEVHDEIDSLLGQLRRVK